MLYKFYNHFLKFHNQFNFSKVKFSADHSMVKLYDHLKIYPDESYFIFKVNQIKSIQENMKCRGSQNLESNKLIYILNFVLMVLNVFLKNLVLGHYFTGNLNSEYGHSCRIYGIKINRIE